MASSYTGLGTELMTTGENAGTWGTTTNTNLQIIEQISGGYTAQSIAGSAQTTTLSVSDGSTGAVLAHRVIEFTGTITGNQVVTIPLDVQQLYVVKNGTSGAYTVQFKYVSGSGSSVTFAATDKGTKLLYAAADHASNPNIVDTGLGSTGAYDLDGNELTLDADSDTSITASTDDQIDIEIAGADDFTFTANAFNVLTGSHATFADSANAKFGTGNDMLMYHDGSNSYITNAVGALKIATETSGIAVTIGHTTSETTIADNLTVTGTLTGTLATAAQGSVTSLGTLTTLTVDNVITNGATIGHTSDTDLMTLADGVLTVAGELDATTLDISGNADIDGTTNLDAVDIDGAVQLDATFTSGVDGQGYDTKFFGDTSSAYMLWDTSADDLVFAGAAGIDLAGDIDVDGTANLDAVDIDGAVQIDGATTVGVDGTGLDVKFFGDTSGSFLLWDQSDDALELTDSSPIKIGDSADMQVYHDGTNSYITNSQGALKIATETSGIALTIGHTTSETTVADNLTVTGDFAAGNFKFGGTDFTDSLLVGHSTTGTLSAAIQNTGVGILALDALTSGDSNTALGRSAASGVTGGAYNTAVGAYAADVVTTSDYNTAVGGSSLGATTGASNTGIGYGAGWRNVTGTFNVSLGAEALEGVSGNSHSYNTAIGAKASEVITTGDYNITLGYTAGDNITTGSGNVVIGKADVSSATGDDQLSISDGEDGSVVWMTGDSSANITFAAEIAAATLDISGAIDIDGTANLDTVDIDGAVQIDATFTSGVDGQGYDTKFFGDTSSAYIMWDTSADKLLTAGGALVDIVKDKLMIGGTAVTTTAAELNKLDGAGVTTTELDYSDLATLGTTAASKVFTADANNLTKITGAVYLEEATLSFDATQDWDVRASPVAKVTLTANVTFDAPSNPTTGQFISIVCIQDGTGSRTIAWDAVFEFASDTAPTATTTASKGDMFNFRYNGAKWLEVGRNLALTLS